jgi:hypothetical protein
VTVTPTKATESGRKSKFKFVKGVSIGSRSPS